MRTLFMLFRGRGVCRLAVATSAVLFILTSAPLCAGEKPTAIPVITDVASLPASNQFSLVNWFGLGGGGEVYFASGGNTGLFRWSQSEGRERLLQTNDPIEVLGLPGNIEIPPGSLLDETGYQLQVNAAGHAAFVVSAAIKGERNPIGIIVYDGSSYRLVQSQETILRLLLNDNGLVAFRDRGGPANTGPIAISMETSPGAVVKVAEQWQPAPVSVGGFYTDLQLIGFNNAGQVAFLADIDSPTTNRAVFLSDGTSVELVVESPIPPTPGTLNLWGRWWNYILNDNGEVAFAAGVNGPSSPPPGIWIGSTSAAPVELMRRGQPTGTSLGGTFSGPFRLRGFNNDGLTLFSSNVSGGTSPHALFLKDLSPTVVTQVVCSQGQPLGSGLSFDGTLQASLNNDDKVAFVATLTGGSSPIGWYLGSGSGAPVQIATQDNEPTPVGGKFGLEDWIATPMLNDSNQVLFRADILELNAVGLFLWTPGNGVGVVTSVVNSNDSLPPGANTVLRFTGVSSDTEVLVQVLKAGGQSTFYANYAKRLKPGLSGLRKIVAEFDHVPDAGTMARLGGFTMNGKGEVVFFARLLGSDFYPRGGLLGSLPGSGLEKVILAGESAPGLGGGQFTYFGSSQLNNQSQLAFYADTDDGRPGIFIARKDDSFEAVARVGDPWPDSSGNFHSIADSLVLNDNGQVAFRGNRPGPQGQGLFVGTGGAPLLKVIQNNVPAPGGGDIASLPFGGAFDLNASGQVAYFATIMGDGEGVFLASEDSGAYTSQKVARTGEGAPGADGATFSWFDQGSISLNNPGQVAFWAGLDNASPTPSSVWSGWFLGSGSAAPSPRLLQNQSLPAGGQAGYVYPGSWYAALANTGEMAIYVAETHGAGPQPQPQIVIAGAGDGALRKFAANGEKALGTGSDFGKLYAPVVATPSSQFLFGAMLVDGPAKAGVFQNGP